MEGLVVVGGHGRLGRAIGCACPAARLLSRSELDLTDPHRIAQALERLAPSVVINAAAVADVDRCEVDPDLAFAVNATGAGALAKACRAVGAALAHVSTDYVFGADEAPPFRETDPVRPWSVYGASKAQGEQQVLDAAAVSCVARVAWLFGQSGDFIDTMLRRAEGQTSLTVYRQTGSPTPVDQAAIRLVALASRLAQRAPTPPILHIAGSPPASRRDWLGAALEGRGGQPCEIVEIDPPALRPPFSALDTTLGDALLGGPIRWRPSAAVAGERFGAERRGA